MLGAFVDRGYDVLTPFGGGQSFDLAVHLDGPHFLHVQCKAAWRRGGCVEFNARSTDHGHGPQSYVGLAEVFEVYFAGTVYLMPVGLVAGSKGRLRLDPPKNNQRKGIRLATEYEIGAWSNRALAELVEPVRSLAA